MSRVLLTPHKQSSFDLSGLVLEGTGVIVPVDERPSHRAMYEPHNGSTNRHRDLHREHREVEPMMERRYQMQVAHSLQGVGGLPEEHSESERV